MRGEFLSVNMPVEIADQKELFQAHSQYKSCFFLKTLFHETQEIKLNLALGSLLKFGGSVNES